MSDDPALDPDDELQAAAKADTTPPDPEGDTADLPDDVRDGETDSDDVDEAPDEPTVEKGV